MKTIFRIFLVLFVLFVLVAGTGIFLLTRPGIQKSLVESQLPEGSSIRAVRITTSSLELSELKLNLPDGTIVRLAKLDTDFKPLAAAFDKTIKLGALQVDGLVVEIPRALIQSSEGAPSVPTEVTQKPAPAKGEGGAPALPESPEAASPMDALYSVGQLEWLFDIESIEVDGELRDASGSSYKMNLSSGSIRPGEETTINASLKLHSEQPLHAGLTQFDSEVEVYLKQKLKGGFEEVRVESLTTASDSNGNNLLTASQKLDLSVKGFDESAKVSLEFNADLPRPELFLPEMAQLGAINLQGNLAVDAQGEAMTLTQTNLLLSASGAERLAVKLNKNFTLGGSDDLSGDLMDLRITDIPLAWLGPWLPEGLELSGNDLSAQYNVRGLPAGAFELSPNAPLQVGPLSVAQNGEPLLNEVTVMAQPVIQIAADQSITWDLGELKVTDRFGEMLSGQSTGGFDSAASSEGLVPAGLQTQTKLSVGLQEISQQPALAQYTSIMTGRAQIDLNVDPSEKHPVQVRGQIDGISSRSYPGQRQDYRFAAQLSEPNAGVVALGANLEAGSENRPSSDMQFAGQVRPDSSPLGFKADLTAKRITQRDLELLAAAFQPRKQTAETRNWPDAPVSKPTPSTKPTPGTAPAQPDVEDTAPPWAGYDGEVNVSIDELYLRSGEVVSDLKAKAVVTEPQLSLKQLEGSFKGGKLSGTGEARYSDRQRMAYAIQTDLNFNNINPATFARRDPGGFPVQGLFDGKAQFAGRGETLDQAIDGLEGELMINGREGVLTAFKLDNRSSLGLFGAGLLGAHLDRPGLTALAQAVPYFENMPFSDFTLKLVRGMDKRIMVPELRFVGRNVLIDGKGSIAATRLKEALDQPMDLTLQLGAKGKLIDYLETLGLLSSKTTEDGFRRWDSALEITGTLSDPDTSALNRILKQAANSALSKPSDEKEAAESTVEGSEAEAPLQKDLQEKEPSKEEKIIRDVEKGLNLLLGR